MSPVQRPGGGRPEEHIVLVHCGGAHYMVYNLDNHLVHLDVGDRTVIQDLIDLKIPPRRTGRHVTSISKPAVKRGTSCEAT